MTRAATLCVVGALGVLAALDPPFSAAGDPAPAQTVTVTTTRTVTARVQGKSVYWWAPRAVQARKDSNVRGRSLRRLRAANRARLNLGATGLERAFLCIHSFEGSWTDSGAPYWGGVQMDKSFMRSYGSPFYNAWGTADHWPPAVQVVVAEAAYLSGRGFHPWPNTARFCGLL